MLRHLLAHIFFWRLSFPTILQMHIIFCNLPQGDKAHEMLELQHPTERVRQHREVLIAISEEILLLQHPQHH